MTTAKILSSDRAQKLLDELSFAINRTDSATLRSWGGRSASRMVTIGGRRVNALSGLVSKLGKGSVKEIQDQFRAVQNGTGSSHFGDRVAAAIDGTIAFTRGGSQLIASIGQSLIDDPKKNAPKVAAAFFGFYAGSGGIDGNGGIPDLDLLAGIDAHRSLLTHSIIAGILAEGVLLATADLAAIVHDRLPVGHDPLWDKLAEQATPLKESLITGTSAGIAYHLLVDAGIQPAPYHDLPFEMPMEAHQGVMGANGLAEGAYAINRDQKAAPALIDQRPVEEPTTGQKIVDAVSASASNLGKTAADLMRGFKRSPAGRRKSAVSNDEDNPAYQVWRPDMGE